MKSIISASASIEMGAVISNEGVFIGENVVVRRGTTIGKGVCIGHNTVIEEDCSIGEDTRIQALVYLAKGTRIDHNVFIGPMVCTTNDKHILSHGRGEFVVDAPYIEHSARIGARVLLLPGVTVGNNALIGAGSVVTKDVGAQEVWYGDQAKRQGTVPLMEVL